MQQMSYNGWPASPDPHAIGVADFVVHGVSFPGGVKRGDVATVLGYVASQWHTRVEPLHPGWCWGYSFRKNRNADNLSCHASASAIDINAPAHPNGKRGTYSAAKAAIIHRILGEVDHVVRWGGDFHSTCDEMHLEIVGTPAEVAAVARRLHPVAVHHMPGTPAWFTRELVYRRWLPAMRGMDVVEAQKWLVTHGFLQHYDSRGASNISGRYDAGTATAVDHCRTAHGLSHGTTLDTPTARLMA